MHALIRIRLLLEKLPLLVFAIIATGFVSHASAADPLPVYFGGFAFLGDFSARNKLYPNTSALMDADTNKPSQLNRDLQQRLQSVNNATFSLELNKLGALGPKSASATALAFALDRETVSIERIAGQYKLLVELSAQVLFFDFKEFSVVASFPMTVQYIDLKRHEPTPAEVQAIVRDLYLGKLGVNIFDEFVSTLKTVALNPSVSRRIKVTAVSIEEESRSALPASLKSDDAALQAFIAQEFGKYLSKNQHIPVLPYAVDSAVGKTMAMRISDGSVYNLKIPQEDYAIQLGLVKFKKVEFQKTAAGSSFIYGAFLHVKALEPLSGVAYFDATIKNGATKIIPAGQDVVDDWAAHQESLLALIDSFTRQLTNPEPEWVDTHTGNKSNVGNMKNFAKVLQSCK
jgi:hypothetical protein